MSALEQRSKKAFDQCTSLADLVEKIESNSESIVPYSKNEYAQYLKVT